MTESQRIEIVGAGPAGLYCAILLKQALPGARVAVSEKNPADSTFGFGVVFSDQALDFLAADDPGTHASITPHMQRWSDITLSIRGERVVLDGIGFAAIGRLELLRLLQQRASAVGVEVSSRQPVERLDDIDADLIVGADGLNSLVRNSDPAAFGPSVEYCDNHFAWFGAPCEFDSLTQTFVETPVGVLNAHHYRYAPGMSTFIVESDAASFDAYGFADMDETESARICGELFADTLGGKSLLINKSQWRRFPRLWCERWSAGRRVLLGDAAHSAHFSIGSGTRLALEDAIALAKAIARNGDIDAALAEFESERIPIALKIVDAANSSARWYDNFREHMDLPSLEFAYSYLCRSGRLDAERLRRIAPGFSASYEEYLESSGKVSIDSDRA